MARTQGSRNTGPRQDRTLTLQVAAAEYIWLSDLRHGQSVAQIAVREGVSVGRVRFGVRRAAEEEARHLPDPDVLRDLMDAGPRLPRLVPLFPIGPFTPQSRCPHHRPIPAGSRLCCAVCHQSGIDAHPGLLRNPRTDPAPDPKPAPPPDEAGPHRGLPRETRRQRRARQFASRVTGQQSLVIGADGQGGAA